MSKRLNPATDAVQRAQQMYPKFLAAAASYFGPVPYGKKPVSQSAADRQLLATPPQDLANLQMTDPNAAGTAQARLSALSEKTQALPPLPGQNTFEP